MLEILLELLLSLLVCGVAAYYFFLSAPVEERPASDGEGASDDAESRPSSAGSSLAGRRGETAVWLNVIARWAALLLLGGGSIDRDVWTDRLAYFIERGAQRLDEFVRRRGAGEKYDGEEKERREQHTLRVRADVVRLVRLELGGGGPLNGGSSQQQQQQQPQQQQQTAPLQYGTSPQVSALYHARTNSDGIRAGSVVGVIGGGGVYTETAEGVGGGTSPPIGAVLPRVGPDGIVSRETPYSMPAHETNMEAASVAAYRPRVGISNTLRCFAVPIIYEDHHFTMQLLCNIPLLFALPAVLKIPADLLTIRCSLLIRRVIFDGVLYAAFYGNMVELSFASEPKFTASFDVSSADSWHRQHLQSHHRGHPQLSPGGSARGIATSTTANANSSVGEKPISLPPSPQCGATSSMYAGHNNSKDKLQEIVNLAVKRSVQFITYPCVLRGVVGMGHHTKPHDHETVGEDTLANSCGDKLMTWSLEKATLPLYL